MTGNPDFIIIGAGINGLLMARNLLASGARVTLIERGQPGREASWAGGGIVSPLYPWRYPAAITALASWAQQYYPTLSRALLSETGIDVQCQSSGLLMLDAEDRAQAISWATANGRELTELTGDAIYAREKGLASGFQDGLWMPQIANIRNPRLCQALLLSLQKNDGFQLYSDCEVTGFAASNEEIESLSLLFDGNASSLLVKGARVIVSAGAWSGSLLESLGFRVDVHPVKGQMLLYKFPQPPLRSIVLAAGRYLIPRQDGHVLAGSTLEYCGFDKLPTQEARESLQESAASILPKLANMQPIQQWAGLRPGSGDGVPYIGKLPDWQNVFINAGQFRNGLVLAPASAQLLCDLLLGRAPIVDPGPFDPGRPGLSGQAETA